MKISSIHSSENCDVTRAIGSLNVIYWLRLYVHTCTFFVLCRLKKSWDLKQVCGISITRGPDQLIALHTKNLCDIVLCLYDCKLENRIPELVAHLCTAFRKAEKENNQPHELKVSIDPNIKGVKCMLNEVTYQVLVARQVSQFTFSF